MSQEKLVYAFIFSLDYRNGVFRGLGPSDNNL